MRAGLRPNWRARAAKHPAAALTAARPDLPAVLALGGRASPADRAQVRVAVNGETDDRAHAPAAAAGPDRPLIAALAPRPTLPVTTGGQLATLATRPRLARRAMRALRRRPVRRDRCRQPTPGAAGVRQLLARAADPLLGPVGAVHAAHAAAVHRRDVDAPVAATADRPAVLIAHERAEPADRTASTRRAGDGVSCTGRRPGRHQPCRSTIAPARNQDTEAAPAPRHRQRSDHRSTVRAGQARQSRRPRAQSDARAGAW